jgi:hypothetical protein
MVAATTTSSKALKSKWLTDGEPSKPKTGRASKKNTKGKGLKSEPGDIPKAILEVASVRAQVPPATFVLYLAINRSITKELILDAEAVGKAGGLEVRFLEQSQLRDFLDTTSMGHWLRQKHLGIDSDFISLPLLQELSETKAPQPASRLATRDCGVCWWEGNSLCRSFCSSAQASLSKAFDARSLSILDMRRSESSLSVFTREGIRHRPFNER